jgi:small-conductance mechanosensitive channel
MDKYDKWSQFISGSFEEFLATLGAYLPSLIAALLLLLSGWVVARLTRMLILRLGTGFGRLANRFGLSSKMQALRLPWSITQIIATIVYWLVILFFLTAAAESLGLPGIATWLSQIIAYLPMIFAGAVIVLLGYLVGAFLRDSITAAGGTFGVQESRLLGQSVYFATLAVAVIIGVGQLGIDVSLLIAIVTISVAALFGAIALAFGLGARTSVANILASHYVRRTYKAGQRIRVGDFEGEILELTPTAVILDTRAGRALVPASLFNEAASVLLDRDDDGHAE